MDKEKKEELSRRKFLGLVAGVPVAAATAVPLAVAAGSMDAPKALKPTPPRMAVAKEEDVSDKPLEFVYDGFPAMLFKREGGYQAYSLVCTHLGCIVSWDAAKKQFECPCHGGIFDENGTVLKGPPPTPLVALAARVEEGVILVQQEEVG